MKVLLLEQDSTQRQIVSDWLLSAGIDSQCCESSKEAITALNEQMFDALILGCDSSGGEKDVLNHLRCRLHIRTPVLSIHTVNARQEIADTLRLGVDDYLVKPFYRQDLIGHLCALIVQYTDQPGLLDCEPYQFDVQNHDLFLHGKALNLTADEYALAAYLFFFRNRIVFSTELARELWGDNSPAGALSVDIQTMNLKRRLKIRQSQNWELQTLLGIGYRLTSTYDRSVGSENFVTETALYGVTTS